MVDVFTQGSRFGLRESFGVVVVIERGFRWAHRLNELRPGTTRFADDVPLRVPPVRGHLASRGCRIILGADGLEQSLKRSYAESQAESAVAVVREKPVDAWLQQKADGGSDRFVAGAGDL